MVTRELIEAELERLNTDDLSKIYSYIKQVEHDKSKRTIEVDILLPQNWDRPGDDESWAHLWLGR